MKTFGFTVAAIVLSSTIAACDSVHGAQRAPNAHGDSIRADSIRADSIRADSLARARQDSINRAQPGYVVDSTLPIEEEMRRFSAAIGGTPVTVLGHASRSREALVKRIVADVARADSADLRAALLTPREFADLVYPSSPYTHPPYRQAPGLTWMLIANPSESGLTRLLRRRGGQPYRFAGYACDPHAERQGANTLWQKCILRLVDAKGDTTTQRWFGSIIARAGRYKLVSYKNQF